MLSGMVSKAKSFSGYKRECQAAMVLASVRVVYMLAAELNMHCADSTSKT